MQTVRGISIVLCAFGLALSAAPSIGTPTITPLTLTVGQPAVVTASCKINTSLDDPALLPGGVNLDRLTNSGAAVSTIGVMHDDGLAGDAIAGDGIFTLQFTANETAAGQFELQCTAAFQGVLQRVKSPAVTVTASVVASSGTISALTVLPGSIPLAVPTSVTTSVGITGGTPDTGSVMLQRLDSSGRVLSIVGNLHDDGVNGDVKANDGIFTLVSTFDEFAPGPISLRVSATFSGAVSHVFSPVGTLTVTGTPAPAVTITAPTSLSFLNISPTTVTGSVNDPTATVVINSIAAPVSGGVFTASVPLAEGPNTLTATATSASGAVGSASITVTLDTTPPHVTITSPANQFVTTDASISVAGNVNDTVVGTVNSLQAQVKVNNLIAQVANRTFLATNVPLNLGSNTIQAVAVDRAGNSATTQITVVRQAPQPGQIQLISGNNQNGTIGTTLPAPLVVSLTDASGGPAANKPVIISVTQNNGMLSVNGGTPAATVMATTNAQGQATATWKLGMRSGAGSDSAQAYSVGYNGTAVFSATANQGPPGLIVIDSGNDQTGAVNQPLPKPLIAVVIDAGHNRLANVPVTFTVKTGGGSFGGQSSIVATTDSDGRAAATLTLGFQEGSSNNIVTADFSGDTGSPAGFTASGLGPGDPAKTEITGLVLDNSNQPIPGVTIRAALTNVANSNAGAVQAAATVQTDAKGRFTLFKAPVGFVKLLVDGSTATVPGLFPTLDYDMVTVAGQINTVGQSIYLLPIKTNNQLCVTAATGGGTLTIPEAPGFSLTFGPGQVTFPGGSKTGCVTVTVVHPDKVPMVPGFGQQPRFIVTIQPSGALFNPPAPITLPNVDGLAPREVTEMYSFDHDIGSFVAIGTGTVSDDGQVIRSSQGVGVLKAGWHCGGNSNTTGAAATCGPCAFCDQQTDTCVPNQVQGNNCQNPCVVGGTGKCVNGYCTGKVNVGAMCGNGGTCDQNGNCVFPCVGPNCGGPCVGPNCGGCGNCNSGNPCIDDSCANGQCVATPNQLCQNVCTGQPVGASCTVGNLTGTCDSSGNCNLCGTLGAGASCTCGVGGVGTCNGSGQCNCQNPTITQVNPNQAQQGDTLDIMISGQNANFVQGGSQVDLGPGVIINSVTVLSPTNLTTNITIAPTATVGGHIVTVTTGTEVASLANGFTVIACQLDILTGTPPTNATGSMRLIPASIKPKANLSAVGCPVTLIASVDTPLNLFAGNCSNGQCNTDNLSWSTTISSSTATLIDNGRTAVLSVLPSALPGEIGKVILNKVVNKIQTQIAEKLVELVGGGMINIRAKNSTYPSFGTFAHVDAVLQTVPPIRIPLPPTLTTMFTGFLPATQPLGPQLGCANNDCTGIEVDIDAEWIQGAPNSQLCIAFGRGSGGSNDRCHQTCKARFPSQNNNVNCDLAFDLDSTSPTITTQTNPAPTHYDRQGNAWVNAEELAATGGNVTANFSCSDPDTNPMFNDVATCPSSLKVSPPIGFQDFVVKSVDTEGNTLLFDFIVTFDNSAATVKPNTFVVNVDTRPPIPTLASVSPVPNAAGWITSTTSATVAYTANDPLPGSGVNTAVSGVQIDGAMTAGTLTGIVTGEGIHTVKALAIDYAGNSQLSTPSLVQIDATPPSVAVTSPTNGQGFAQLTINVAVQATDNTSGVDPGQVKCAVDYGHGPTFLTATSSGNSLYVCQGVPLAQGQSKISAVANDKAGNQGIAPTITVSCSSCPPM